VSAGGPPYSGTAEIVCAKEGDKVEIVPMLFGSPVCHVYIPPQTIGTEAYETVGSGASRYIVATANGEGLEYSPSGGGGLCGVVGTHHDGTFKGEFELSGVQ
jgi:hypothetical protein